MEKLYLGKSLFSENKNYYLGFYRTNNDIYLVSRDLGSIKAYLKRLSETRDFDVLNGIPKDITDKAGLNDLGFLGSEEIENVYRYLGSESSFSNNRFDRRDLDPETSYWI